MTQQTYLKNLEKLRAQLSPDRHELTKEEADSLAHTYGAGWCPCPYQAMARVTPEMLAAYCMKRGFKEYPKPSADGNGIRYQYAIGKKKVERDKQIVEVVEVAAFGDFPHFPKAQVDSIMESIRKIADNDGRTAADIAEDIYDMALELATDPELVK